MKHLLSILSVCCFFFISTVCASTPVEKGSRSKIKVKIIPEPIVGPTGPKGPAGTSPSTAYATAFQEGSVSISEQTAVTVPFSTVEVAKNISFNNTENSFILPSGTFCVHFQFTLVGSGTDQAGNINPKSVYLQLTKNGATSLVSLTWTSAFNNDQDVISEDWLACSGSAIFQVLDDETTATLIMEPSSSTASFSFAYPDPNQDTENHATRIVFTRVDDI